MQWGPSFYIQFFCANVFNCCWLSTLGAWAEWKLLSCYICFMRTGSSNRWYYVCMCTQACVVVFTEDVFCALGAHHSHVVPVTPFIMIWFVVLSGALQQTHFSVWSPGPGRLTAQTHRHLYNQCLHFIDPMGMCLITRLCQLRWNTEHSSVSSVSAPLEESRQREWEFEVWNEKQKQKQSTFYRSTRFVCDSGILPSRSEIHIVCVPGGKT